MIPVKNMTEALERLQGSIVIGILPSARVRPKVGHYAKNFGSDPLPRGVLLLLTKEVTKADWDLQHQALFGREDTREGAATCRFFKCTVVRTRGAV